MTALEERINQLVAEFFEDSPCFLVDIKLSGARDKIQIFVDCPDNISIDKCVKLSRFVEKFIEEEGLVNPNYVLEVSSPGSDQPLKVVQQFQKNLGRNLDVLLTNGIRLEGILKSFNEEGIVVEQHLPPSKKQKRKETEIVTHELLFSDIKTTTKKITFFK